MTRLNFIIFDDRRLRAATIAAALSRRGVAVTDGLPVLGERPITSYVALVADGPSAIRVAIERLRFAGIRAKIIAYDEEPTPHAMVKAMSAGAADYLDWPCDPAEIIAAATAATATAIS